MQSAATQFGVRRPALVFVFSTVLMDSIGFGIVLPVLPELIRALTGESLSQASVDGGWLGFAFALTQFFCAPVLGNLSDRYGRRPVLLACLFAFGIDYLIMGLAPGLPWLFAGRIIAGATGASFSPAYAYIADISPPASRARNFGVISAAFGVGFVLGPAIGGLLGTLGPRAPFFAAAALGLTNFGFGCFALPESLPRESRRAFHWKRANPAGTLVQLRKYPVVFGLAGAMFLWQLAHQVLPSTWAFYTMLKFHWSSAAVGASLAFVGIIMAVSQGWLTGVLIPRLGERRALLLGLAGALVCYSGYAFSTTSWMLYASMLPWLLGAMAYPSMNALMSQQVGATAQGELQGGVASLNSLSAILGPPLMTQLFGYFSAPGAPMYFPGAAFLCATALVGVSLSLCLRSVRAKPALQAAPAAETAG